MFVCLFVSGSESFYTLHPRCGKKSIKGGRKTPQQTSHTTMTTLKKIDKDSSEGIEGNLNLFELPPTNVAVNKSAMREHLPLSTITQEGPYVFRIFADNQFIDLSKTQLLLILSLEKKDGSDFKKIERYNIPKNPTTNVEEPPSKATGDKNISVVNNILHSFVKQLKISINNTECFDSGVHYAYRAYIQQETSYSLETNRGLYEAVGYFRDDDNQNAVPSPPTKNGVLRRAGIFEAGQKGTFIGRLHFDLANQPNYLVNNSDVIFTIYRNSDDFLLHIPSVAVTNNVNDYRIRVHDIRLYSKAVDVTQSLNNAISQHLEKTPARYAPRRIEIRSLFVGKGRQDLAHNIFTSVIPRRLIVGFVATDAYSGHRAKSPFVFEHANVESISVEANGLTYPSVPYRYDFSQNDYVRAFVDFYTGLGYDTTINNTCSISMNRFKTGWCFFVIPMTSTLEDSAGFELIRNGTTTLKVRFKTAIPDQGYEMIVWGEFDHILSINADRVLSTDGAV